MNLAQMMTLIYDKYNHKRITAKVQDNHAPKGDVAAEVKTNVNQYRDIFVANEVKDVK